jgi:hypothetical protein
MVINAHHAGVRKRSMNPSTSPAIKPIQADSPPSTPPPLEQAYIAPMLPPPELTTSHSFLTSRPPLQFDHSSLVSAQPIPHSSSPYSRGVHSASYSDLTYPGTSHMAAFDAFGSSPQSLPSLGSLYQDHTIGHAQPSLSYGASGVSMISGQMSMPLSQHSNTPSPVPSTLSISSTASNGYYDTHAPPAVRGLDTNGLVYPSEFSPSDRFQPPPISTAYMSLHALDNAHQSWHTQTGGGRSIHGPSARLMRA